MKKLLYISFLILFLVSCKQPQSSFPTEKNIVVDTIAIEELPNFKADTLTKISKPFLLNNLSCYWEHFFLVYDYGGIDFITMKLYDYKTKKILLEYEHRPKHYEDYDYKSEHYFDFINKRHFDDFNFDGFKDFTIYSHGSMPMTSSTNIFLFNNETKTFEYSDLSDTVIEEMDSINRTLTTYSFWLEGTSYTKYYFDKKGKIKFTELTSETYYYPNDTTEMKIMDYTKIINGEEIETKIDTIKFE